MHREYRLLPASAVLIVGILVLRLVPSAIAFVAGAVLSATAGYLGMYAATKANVRSVAANTEGAASALNIALRRLNHGPLRGVAGSSGARRSYYYFGGDPHCSRDPRLWHGGHRGTLLARRWRHLY